VNRKFVDAWFGAFRDKDISTLERTLAEDFVHTSPYGVIRGRQAYLDLVRENAEAFFSPIIENLDVIEGGDKLSVRYLLDENPACDCIYVRNGQISEIYSYYHVGEKPASYNT
jgi:ketosteroid isomerase-like protein